MLTVTRRIEFDYGHRVLNHEGKCKYLHGHRGVVLITVSAPELDSVGRVIDFGVIKEKVGGWIDKNFDHNMILHPEDPLISISQNAPKPIPSDLELAAKRVFDEKKPFIMPEGFENPTAENIVVILYRIAMSVLSSPMRVQRVRFFETPNSYADYSP